jgi:Tfp pilus assembly protein PilN
VLEHGLPPRIRVADAPFGADRLDEALEALRPHLGRPRRIAVAIDLHLLIAKRLTLPAVPAAERRNIVRLEPERFFAMRDEDVVAAVRTEDNLVFATTASALRGWVETIEAIAPVDVIEPTPVALSRALATISILDAAVLFDAQSAGVSLAVTRQGRVTHARRLFGTLSQITPALADEELESNAAIFLDPWSDERCAALDALGIKCSISPVPPISSRAGDVPGPFAAAFGAALALEHAPSPTDMLLAPLHESRIRTRRIRARGLSVMACATAVLFAISSLEDRQDRALRDLDGETTSLAARAAPALAMQTELATLERRAAAIRSTTSERRDPLHVLRALATALPAGAFVRQIRASGADWQIDGYAPNASAVLTALGTSRDFRDAHFLSATSRAQIANKQYESFALAFRFGTAP